MRVWTVTSNGHSGNKTQIEKDDGTADWFQVCRWGQRWRGSTCVCLRVCVLWGCITCWHTAAGKSSLVCLKQDDEICRRAPNARAAVTLNHSHTSNPHAVTQHTPTHTYTRAHTNTHIGTHAAWLPDALGPLCRQGRRAGREAIPVPGATSHGVNISYRGAMERRGLVVVVVVGGARGVWSEGEGEPGWLRQKKGWTAGREDRKWCGWKRQVEQEVQGSYPAR